MTFSKIEKITIAFVALAAFAAAQTPPAAPAAPGPKFKDDKEQTLAIAANTEKDPKAQLEKLDKWKHDYPETEYAVPRLGLYFTAYGALKDYHNQVMTAQELRKADSGKLMGNLQLLRTIFTDVPLIKPPSAEDLAAMQDAANFIVDHPDEVFDAKNKPAGQTDAQWAALKPQMIDYAKNQLDWVAEQQSADAVTARLKQDPTRVNLNVWLGKSILAEAKAHPERQSDAIFNYARAAVYTGPGALDQKTRDGMKGFVDRAYKTYHGSADGEDKLLAAAANSAVPNGYVIESTVDVAKDQVAADEAKRKANPMLALWNDTKTALLSGTAPVESVVGAGLPGTSVPEVTKFKGKIVSMTPAIRPRKIVVAVEKDGVGDATLVFAAPLPGKMEAGSEIEFSGEVKEVSKDPYMLTFSVEKADLEGWTGKNAPAPRAKKQ